MQSVPQAAWRVEADTVPQMESGRYRSELIYQTSQITEFLSSSQLAPTILVAPKGYGKTLLLNAKKIQFLEARSAITSPIIMGRDVFIDRPGGLFPVMSDALIKTLAGEYELWKSLWKISIAAAAVKAFSRSTRDPDFLDVDTENEWLQKVLSEDSKAFEATEIFVDLFGRLALDYRAVMNLIAEPNYLFTRLNRINTTVAFFIDNVDEYFKPALDDRSVVRNLRTLYRNRDNQLWSLAQIALISAAYDLQKNNHHLKVFCTVRQEAFLRMPEVENDSYQISARCIQIQYTPQDLAQIFLKNIELTPRDRLVEPDATDIMTRFVGSQNLEVRHRFVMRAEPIFDYFLRHSLYRPRDLMYIGRDVARVDPGRRSIPAIQTAVDHATKAIADSIFTEMRPFFSIPRRRHLFLHIPTNVLSADELNTATDLYLAGLRKDREDSGEVGDLDTRDQRQPFSVLHKIGLLGVVRHEFGRENRWRQSFLEPTEIQMNTDSLPRSSHYLLHPALDQSVHEASGGRFARLYHTQNIVGNRLGWVDPLSYSFVLKGDIVGYSKVMSSEMYETVINKLYEWSRELFADLIYADLSAGDSIVLIDQSAAKVIQCARELVQQAAAFHERPLMIRFGGAAGPISFDEFRVWHDGVSTKAKVPLGLALRTSARLEPYARPGHILIDEVFYEFASVGLGREFAVAVTGDDLRDLKYDEATQRFSVQKNELDVPHLTRLWEIALDS